MVGAPVASVLGLAATGSVAALVRDSWYPSSSVNVTRTFMVAPWSAGVSA